MKISHHWIEEFTNIPVSPQELALSLSTSLAEVEGIKDFSGWFDGIVVGKIESIKAHPNADKLQITHVEVGGDEKLDIICGAKNINEGDYVPVATVGTTLHQLDHKQEPPLTIEKREIRGVESNGMLCSPRELGISDDHSGILILNDEPNVRIGEHFATLVKANDIVYEIENKALTHRPDTFSHQGIAREIAAVLDTDFTPLSISETKGTPKAHELRVDIQNTDHCRRYSAAVLNNIEIKPSPLWMQLRLRSLGVRPINNIVDITNYVMLEIGQPLHAFDKDTLHGDSILIRSATPNETLTTLDGETRTLDTDALVIADEQGAIALAGIMGGEKSEVTDKTTTIVLESANFEMYNNRKTARKLGLHTEATTRFSKDQDPEKTIDALHRAIELMKQYANATVVGDIVDDYPRPRAEKSIDISTQYIINHIGDPDLTSKTEIIDILRRLDIIVSEKDNSLNLTIPSFRPDLRIKADIVEEIARIKGYDNIALTLPKRDLTPAPTNSHIMWIRRTKLLAAQIGFTEVYNYSFVGKNLYEKCNLANALEIELKNPTSPDTTHLRPYLLPSVINNIDTNRKHYDHVALFELEKGITPTKPDELPKETHRLALTLYDHEQHHNYGDIKGVVEHLLANLHIPEVSFSPVHKDEDPIVQMFSPARRAVVMSRGEVLGYVGELNPHVQVEFGFQGVVGMAELDADALYELTNKGELYRPVSVHPELTIDISCVLDQSLSLDQVRNTLTQAGSELLVQTIAKDAEIDTDKFGEGKKAVTFRLVFQSSKHSLAKDDVALDVQNVKNILHENFAAELRS